MKRIIFIIAILASSLNIFAQDIVSQANEKYSAGEFDAAASLYEQALDENGASAQVYYNLANAYYRMNRIASSILNYERALLLEPSNEDIFFNLEIAKLKTVDNIQAVNQPFFVDWYKWIQNRFTTNIWSVLAIVFFILFIVGIFLFFFSKKTLIKKLGFYSALVLIVFVVFANIFAYQQKKDLTVRDTAIVFSATTTIKSSPDISGTDLFVLHEGTKVQITDQVGAWTEIKTPDGHVGWIRAEEIEII